LRIRYTFGRMEKIFDHPHNVVVLGRPREGVAIDIDLSPDLRVSRPHARVSLEKGRYWLEDLGSTNGTTLDDVPIPARTRMPLRVGQVIRISETNVVLEDDDEDSTIVAEAAGGKASVQHEEPEPDSESEPERESATD